MEATSGRLLKNRFDRVDNDGMKLKRRVAQTGAEQLYLPKPMADLSSVLEAFWEPYARERESGKDAGQACFDVLAKLLPIEDFIEVISMFSGSWDEKINAVPMHAGQEPFDGREMHEGLMLQGDKTWAQYQQLDGWPW